MATPAENLARSLEVLKVLQDDDVVAIHTSSMTRVHRERLLENGFIQEVIKGWYIAGNPQDRQGDSTPWYTAFWQFCGQYLDYRFGNAWSVSPEQSISLHTGNQAVPTQLLVRSEKAGNNLTKLMHGTSLLDVAGAPAEGKAQEVINGVRVYSLPSALAECGPAFYQQTPSMPVVHCLVLLMRHKFCLSCLKMVGVGSLAGWLVPFAILVVMILLMRSSALLKT